MINIATLQSAKEKYARKMATAATNWNAAKPRMTSNWASGMSSFLGAPVAGHIVSSYQAGINAAQYRGGDPDKWERNLRAKMTGG